MLLDNLDSRCYLEEGLEAGKFKAGKTNESRDSRSLCEHKCYFNTIEVVTKLCH